MRRRKTALDRVWALAYSPAPRRKKVSQRDKSSCGGRRQASGPRPTNHANCQGGQRTEWTGPESSKEVFLHPQCDYHWQSGQFFAKIHSPTCNGRPPPSRPAVRPPARKRYCVQSLPERYRRPLPPWDVCFSGSFFCAEVDLPASHVWITRSETQFPKTAIACAASSCRGVFFATRRPETRIHSSEILEVSIDFLRRRPRIALSLRPGIS